MAKIREPFYSISSRFGNSEFETVQVLLLGRERFYWETTKHISAQLISETSDLLENLVVFLQIQMNCLKNEHIS
jgi:hypothetical protein